MQNLGPDAPERGPIAEVLGDTGDGLTGSEIEHLLEASKIADVATTQTKRHRLYNAFAKEQNVRQERSHILTFIRFAMNPERFARVPERFEPMRTNLNRALAFAGLLWMRQGALVAVEQARTLSEAQCRAQDLLAELTRAAFIPICSASVERSFLPTTIFTR